MWNRLRTKQKTPSKRIRFKCLNVNGYGLNASMSQSSRIWSVSDAFLASVAASQAGLYGIVPSGHPYLERVASPLQQPQVQVPALPLGAVKQEPRESTSSCQGLIGERSSSKSSERRHLTSTPRAPADPGRREPPKESSLPSAKNNNSSIIINNNNSVGGRSQGVQKASGSRSQSKPAEKKDVLKVSSAHEHVPGKDRRPEAAVKPADKRVEPVPDRPRAAPGSGLVIKSDSGKCSGVPVPLKSPKGPATKPANNAAQQRVTCSKESLAVAASKTVATTKKIPNSRDGNNSALQNGAGKPNNTEKDAAERKSSPCSVKVSNKREEQSTKTSTGTPADTGLGADTGAKTQKKRPRDRSDNVKDGRGDASAMDKRTQLQGASSGSDVRSQAAVSPASSTCSLTPKSTSAPAATSAAITGPGALNGSPPQAVPTLATVTSTSSDVSTVTSVPVTSGGTQSVFARSQPVASTAVSASGEV